MATKDTMKAVVFKAPYEVAVEDRPVPKIKDPQDIIVKVKYTALCGRWVASHFLGVLHGSHYRFGK